MSELIRIYSGITTHSALMADGDTLVTNWPVQTDQPPSIEWSASQRDEPLMRLSVGGMTGGNWNGFYEGSLYIYIATEDMRDYLCGTVFGDALDIAATIRADSRPLGMRTFTCRLELPYSSNNANFSYFSNELDHTIALAVYQGVDITDA